MQDIVRRQTIEDICRHRDAALAARSESHAAILIAQEAEYRAAGHMRAAAPMRERNSFNQNKLHPQQVLVLGAEVLEHDAFIEDYRRSIDQTIWAHVMELTDLQRLMDKEAKAELRASLMENPPPATVENITATLEQFMFDAGTIWKRGIAKCFSDLDRRFRSHDGWKIGSRVILSYAFNEYGSWNYHQNHQDSIRDIERVFYLLDNVQVPDDTTGIIGLLSASRGYGPEQIMVENEYFRVRKFKNGNCHIWFKRDDLLLEVNKLLNEYYNAAIPQDSEPDEDSHHLNKAKTSLAKNYGFFPTPPAAADKVINEADILQYKGGDQLRILEPSAGTGNLALRCVQTLEGMSARDRQWYADRYRHDNLVDCIEIQQELAGALQKSGKFNRVTCADFLQVRPQRIYDRVVMNPPFDRERDIDHVVHALKFLRPGGKLVAIMSANTEFRETKKSKAFRAMIEKMDGTFRDLPNNSFSSVGTNINTLILSVRIRE